MSYVVKSTVFNKNKITITRKVDAVSFIFENYLKLLYT